MHTWYPPIPSPYSLHFSPIHTATAPALMKLQRPIRRMSIMAVLNSTVVLQFHVVCKSRGCTTLHSAVTVLINLTSQPRLCEPRNTASKTDIHIGRFRSSGIWRSAVPDVSGITDPTTRSYPQKTWILKNTTMRITNNKLSLHCYKTYRCAVKSNIWRQCTGKGL